MIRILLCRDVSGVLTGFSVSGHSGWAAKGQDIVCAGVSALTQGAALGLQRHLGIALVLTLGDGTMECQLPRDLSAVAWARSQDILETMRLGLEQIAAHYPRQVTLCTEQS